MGTTSNEHKMSSERRHDNTGSSSSISSAFASANPQFEPRKLGKTKLTLERVLGLSCLSNAMLAVNPVTGEIAYAAGCIVVIYNLRRNKQVRYYRVEKTVSCICYSSNGQYLAIGEKGYLPAVTIWDGNDGSLCAELQLHKYGISCMAFSKDNKYLITAGLVHDQHLYVWDLTRDPTKGNHMAGKVIGGAEIHEKVLSMDFCQEGNFFVTVGEKHFKFWFLGPEDKFIFTGLKVNNQIPEIQYRDAVMSTKSDATYMSVACGYGACNLKTFAVTSDGVLCCFGASGIMERLVSLEASQGFSLSVTEAYVAVGGSSSIIRLFDPLTLEYRMTLPFGPEFGKANDENQHDPSELVPPHPHRQPAAIGVRVTGSHVVALYSDRSMFVYELQSSGSAQTSRSFLYHSGCIRDLQIAGKVKGVNAKGKIVYEELSETTKEKSGALPNGTFVSTSDDNTLRFWHLDLHKSPSSSKSGRFDANSSSSSPEQEKFKNPYSQEMLHVVYHDKPVDFEDPNGLFLGGTCSSNYAPDIHMPAKDHGPVNGLRALALHPNKTQVVAGDKEGNVAVIQVSTMESKIEIGAHNSEVHAVAFSPAPAENRHLLASGGRDRLVHVYDCKDGSYNVVKTLDNHSAAVTGLAFSNDGKKIISCGADKTIVLSNTSDLTRYNSIPFTSGKILDVKLTSDDEYLVASCTNRLDLYSIGTGKHVKSHHVGEQHHIDICPANFCVAMSGSLSDKTIHLIDLETGDTLAEATGHGEAITSLKFTPDCRRLLSSSSDGCIFVWRLSEEIQSVIKSKLPKLKERGSIADNTPMPPPPAPPTPAPKTMPAPVAVTPAVSTLDSASLLMPPAPPAAIKKVVQPPPSALVAVAAPNVPVSMKAEEKGGNESKQSGIPAKVSGWKGAAKAVPGPMGNVPMEDWMKTRVGPKKAVQFSKEQDDDDMNMAEEQDDEMGESTTTQLNIDRSRTPDWARTIAPGQMKRLMPSKITPDVSPVKAKGKWAKATTLQEDQEMGEETIVLKVDRDMTPVWARTMRSGEIRPIIKKQEETAVKVHGKWGGAAPIDPFQGSKQAAVVEEDNYEDEQYEKDEDEVEALYIKQRDGELHRLDISQSKGISGNEISNVPFDVVAAAAEHNMSEEDDLMSLSMGDLSKVADEFANANGTLAQEREQLDRKKKQIDTANAVANMNSKLAQLGILRSQKSKSNLLNLTNSLPETSKEEDVPVAERSKEPIRGSIRQSIARGKGNTEDIPNEMLESVDFGSAERKDCGVTSSIDFSQVNQSMSAFTSGYAQEKPKGNLPVQQSMDMSSVNQSLSAFTSGYKEEPTHQKLEPNPSMNASVQLDLRAVNQSLSSFTSGYEVNQSTQLDLKEVNQSLSAFTSGYKENVSDRQPVTSPSVTQSLDLSSVNASLSNFTSGYKETAASSSGAKSTSFEGQSLDISAVSKSLSSFTTGYTDEVSNATPSVLVQQSRIPSTPSMTRSLDLTAVGQSLSTFSSGYSETPAASDPLQPVRGGSPSKPEQEKATPGLTQSVIFSKVGAYLSSFTSGYAAKKTPGVVGGSMDFSRVDQSLSTFTTGYATAATKEQETVKPKETAQSLDFSQVNASMSAFTSGYTMPSTKKEEIISDDTAVESAPGSRIICPLPSSSVDETKVEEKTTFVSTISDLDRNLEAAMSQLEVLESFQGAEEVREMVAQLREKIQEMIVAKNATKQQLNK